MEQKFLLLLLLPFMCVITTIAQTTNASYLISCLVSSHIQNFTIATSLHTSSYYNLLDFSIRNYRFAGKNTGKPVAIVLPSTKHELRSSVVCCRNSSLSIRLRSGGHSYEGLSYTATNPFVLIDLMNLNRVRVNLTSSRAWVESGATLGDIYRAIATESNGSLGFPAGSCATVGSGGHIGGGGFGFLGRKYGLAADNVFDAVLIDSVGRVLDRDSMGDDVFWAIRGGGGGNWGAIYAWEVGLVPVPIRITVFRLGRVEPSRFVAKLVHKWQYVAPGLPDEYYLSVFVSAAGNGNDTTSVEFTGQFLGPSSQAVAILTRRFPELGLAESDCTEMSWIETVVHFAGLSTIAELTDRKSLTKSYFKGKSDYVRTPISITGLIGAFAWLAKEPSGYVILDPYGGAMGRIRSSDLPFPHRRGNLYGIQYMVDWTEEEDRERYKYVDWIRGFYEYMAKYVSSNPRAAYVNYVDLDLGIDDGRGGSDRVWGEKYFLANYDRLVKAKTAIDRDNVFSNVQSILPLVK